MNSEILNYALLFLIFAAVVLGALAIAPMFQRKVDLASRISTQPTASLGAAGSSKDQSLRTDSTSSIWARLVAEVESRGLSLEDDKAPILKERLAMAGYHQDYAVRAFVLARTALALLVPIIVYTMLQITGATMAPRTQYMVDLMLVCVEAGLGIDACFARVGQEVVNLHPRLARLFAGVSLELRAGRARADALKNMAKKSGVPEIQSFATLIVQSEKLGASIGQALKVYAGEMRESRRMRAEEKAHRLPVLLSVPLVIFLLPTMVGVLGLPAVIKIVGLDI